MEEVKVKKMPLRIATGLVFTLFIMNSCERMDPITHRFPPAGSNTGDLVVRLTDQPANYLEVNVAIKQLEAHLVDSNDSSGWVMLNTVDTIYNLLTLQNNITAALAAGEQLPAGKISQLRLLLGENNTVMLSDSSIHPLNIPSGQNTGIKINLNTNIIPGATTVVVLDFDAAESVRLKGNGVYQLSPVIKVKSITVL